MIYSITTSDFANISESYAIKCVKNGLVYIESNEQLEEPFEVTELPAEAAQTEAKELAAAKEGLKSEVNSLRDSYCAKKIFYNNYYFSATEKDQNLIASTILLYSEIGLPSGFVWITDNNSQVSVTLNDLKSIAAKIGAQTSEGYIIARNIKDLIEGAKSIKELNAIDIKTPFAGKTKGSF